MLISLNVLPPSAAPSAAVPHAPTAKASALVSRAELAALCSRLLDVASADRDPSDALRAAGRALTGWLNARAARLEGSAWLAEGRRLAKYLIALASGRARGAAPFRIFTKGNAKLPFWSFSTLPVFSCPGAGECAAWCYSFHGWRNVGPFYRQLQNTLLVAHRPDLIRGAFLRLPRRKGGVTVRLYVDGDFGSLADVALWMDVLTARPDVRAYGYSKSWDLLLAYHRAGGRWATNYELNLSSGGASYATRDQMTALPVYRGDFVVLPSVRLGKGPGRYTDPLYRSRLRAATRAAGLTHSFPCPGDCGACSSIGPVCGSSDPRLKGLTVVIGAH